MELSALAAALADRRVSFLFAGLRCACAAARQASRTLGREEVERAAPGNFESRVYT